MKTLNLTAKEVRLLRGALHSAISDRMDFIEAIVSPFKYRKPVPTRVVRQADKERNAIRFCHTLLERLKARGKNA